MYEDLGYCKENVDDLIGCMMQLVVIFYNFALLEDFGCSVSFCL